jgi:glucose/arabinose dehydrogenase
MARLLVPALFVVALTLLAAPTAHAAGPGEIEGTLPPGGGIAGVTWGGGSVAELDAAARDGGCGLRSVWVFIEGKPVGQIIGAPDFVNVAFLAAFPGGEIPAQTIMLLVCEPIAAAIGEVAFAPALGGRVFDRAIELVPYPGDRFLVAEQDGRVLLVNSSGGGESVFLDLAVRRQGTEEGLLSVALDPAFGTNGHVWVYYSVADGERRTRLSRFQVTSAAAVAASELAVLEVTQPFSNHNGGAIRFGPDGMLYLGLGDGGSSGDPQGHGQNTGTLLGSIIRIDVRNASASQPYAIPSDNPFAAGGGRGEIWAYGFRNPWRMAFDAATGELWVGDVGQSAVEEIDVVVKGGNFGWNRLEGDQCYQSGCSFTGTVLPVATYRHDQGCSVTGGVVSRSASVPEVAGAYLFADYCSGRVWAMDAASRGEPVQVGRVDGNPTSFAVDATGRVYIVQFGGPVLQLVSP